MHFILTLKKNEWAIYCDSMVACFSVVGFSGSGKTTVIEALVKKLVNKGFKIAVIKHHHREIDLDVKGKDTDKYSKAGARFSISSSPKKLTIFENTGVHTPLKKIKKLMEGKIDILIAEGFTDEEGPKIEIFRKEVSEKLRCEKKEDLIAIVSDDDIDVGVLVFSFCNLDILIEYLIEKKIIPTN